MEARIIRNENVESFKLQAPDGSSSSFSGTAGSSQSFAGGDGQYSVIAVMPDGREEILTKRTFSDVGTGDLSSPFVIRVDTTNSGDTASDEFRVSTNSGTYTYNYDVSWSKVGGSNSGSTTGQTGDYVIDTDDGGVYEVEISGTLPHMKYGFSVPDSSKIVSIEQWGTIQWESMNLMLSGANNLDSYNATDNPDLSNVQDMSGMFEGASSFDGEIGSWNTSNVQNMSRMFIGAFTFNADIGSWDTGNVQNMSEMLAVTGSFNQDISSWDTSNVTDMNAMFNNAGGFNQDISPWDTSNVTDMRFMFNSANSFNQNISTWCVSNIGSEPNSFDDGAGFDGETSKQPDWGTTTGC